jgi:hypothetical protein
MSARFELYGLFLSGPSYKVALMLSLATPAWSAPATPNTAVPAPGAAPNTGPVWWEGQVVLQLPTQAKPP